MAIVSISRVFLKFPLKAFPNPEARPEMTLESLGRSDRIPLDKLKGKLHLSRRGSGIGYPVQEKSDGFSSKICRTLSNGAQSMGESQIMLIKTDERNVSRHPEPMFFDRPDRSESHLVGHRPHRCRRLLRLEKILRGLESTWRRELSREINRIIVSEARPLQSGNETLPTIFGHPVP